MPISLYHYFYSLEKWASSYTKQFENSASSITNKKALLSQRCAQYMGALKSFESPRKRPRLLFPKFVKGFCSDRY